MSKDLQSFQEFLTSKLTPAPNVKSVKTSLTIRTAKHEPGVPQGRIAVLPVFTQCTWGGGNRAATEGRSTFESSHRTRGLADGSRSLGDYRKSLMHRGYMM